MVCSTFNRVIYSIIFSTPPLRIVIPVVYSIKYSNNWNLSTPVLYPENKTLLMPGGPGYVHATGKARFFIFQKKIWIKNNIFFNFKFLFQTFSTKCLPWLRNSFLLKKVFFLSISFKEWVFCAKMKFGVFFSSPRTVSFIQNGSFPRMVSFSTSDLFSPKTIL